MPRFDPIITLRLRWLLWKLRLKGWLLKRYWPHTYQAVHNPIWAEGDHHVYHDWGGGFIVSDGRDTTHHDTFSDVIRQVRS